MRDDERYPTVVEPGDAPEALPYQTIDSDGNVKAVAVASPSTTLNSAASPATIGSSHVATPPGSDQAVGKFDDAGLEVVPGSQGRSPKILGMKRRTFLILIAVLIAVIVAAVVGGVVGSRNSGDDSEPEAPPSSTDSPTPTGRPLGPVQTGPIELHQRRLAVAASADNTTQNLQIFYNDLETRDILYRRTHNDDPGDEHKVDLDIPPNYGSPIAAAALNVSDPVVVNLYYLNTTTQGRTQVVEAILSCNASNNAECTTESNSVITGDITGGVHPRSKLAALRLGDEEHRFLRVYFQQENQEMRALNGDNPEGAWTAITPIKDVWLGSDIAAVSQSASQLDVFFVSNETHNLRHTPYNDIEGIPDYNSQAMDNSPGSSWDPTDNFAAIYVPQSIVLCVFFANTGSGKIASYFRDAREEDWNEDPDPEERWINAESGLAATSWKDEVRLFFFHHGALHVSAQHGPAWDTPRDLTL